MADYYTHSSEYSPIAKRYSDQMLPMEQQAQVVTHDIVSQPQYMAPQQPVVVQQPVQPAAQQSRQFRYNLGGFTWDAREIFKRAIKYLLEGLAVAFVAYIALKHKLDFKDIAILGVTAAFVFAILDTFSPTIALGTRFGAGFGVGQTLFGLNPTLLAPVRAVV